MLSLLLACTDAVPQDSAVEEELEFLFSFAVVADPHLSTTVEHDERLAGAVAWINDNAAAENIELVWVVGDIGWGEGLLRAPGLLGELTPPYVPIIGDNEVHFGDEENFDQVFEPTYSELGSTFDDFQRGQIEVYNPQFDQTSWLQNFSFSHRGLRWIGLDWCSRDTGLQGEFAELHDFDGGTLPFFQNELAPLEATESEDVLLFSHHPMHIGLFDLAEMETLTATTGPIAGRVAGAWAGHLHLDGAVEVPDAGYTAFVTDATWDDENTVRLVQVHGNGQRFEYTQELVLVPW